MEYFKDHNLETFSNTFFCQKYFAIFREDCLKSLGIGKSYSEAEARDMTFFVYLTFGSKRLLGMLMSENILLHICNDCVDCHQSDP